MLLDSKAEVAVVTEVLCLELELTHLEALLEDLCCLLSTDGDVHGDLLVSADTERPHSVAG